MLTALLFVEQIQFVVSVVNIFQCFILKYICLLLYLLKFLNLGPKTNHYMQTEVYSYTGDAQ